MKRVFDMVYSNKECLSAARFLSLSKEEKANILSSKPVPAPLGSNSFGWIEVTYKTGRYISARLFR